MYHSTVPQFIKMLNNLSAILDKGAKHAEARKFDMTVLLNARLAPDQYHLIKQIQVACDVAKGTAARLTGQEPPRHEDNEQTLEQLHARIEKTIQYLKTFKAEDFKDAEKRPVNIPWKEGKFLPGFEYTTELAVPNFYFHVTTAYAILRHNGVEVGKADFLGNVKFRDR